MDKILEVIGRGFVVISFAWTIHISEWYQSFPYNQMGLNSWSIITGIILFGLLGWMFLPFLNKQANSQEDGV